MFTCSGMEQMLCYHYDGVSACQRVAELWGRDAQSVQQFSAAYVIQFLLSTRAMEETIEVPTGDGC